MQIADLLIADYPIVDWHRGLSIALTIGDWRLALAIADSIDDWQSSIDSANR